METASAPALIRQTWFRVFALCGALELLSYLTWFLPAARLPALLIISALALYLALRDARLGFLILLAEAIIGSHGHLIAAGPVSLRMTLFAVALVGWLVDLLRRRVLPPAFPPKVLADSCARLGALPAAPPVGWRSESATAVASADHLAGFAESEREQHFVCETRVWPRLQASRLFLPLAAIFLAVVWGVIRGLWLGHGLGTVVADANAYAFILAVPLALDLFRRLEDRALLWEVAWGAALWLAVKSLALLYLFSHDFGPWLVDLYQWQRKFGLTEITRLGETAWHRVFAASDIFLLPVFVLGVFRSWVNGWRWRFGTVILAAALVLSFSRSFALGLVAGAFVLIVALTWRHSLSWRLTIRTAAVAVTSLLAGLLLLLILVVLPLPTSRGGFDAALFGSRLSADDAAVTSRWNLLTPLWRGIGTHPLAGSGFGATVTYRSDDPRLISLFPGGVVTTGAVEWQYLEIWLKLGLPGLLAFAWLIIAVLRRLWADLPRGEKKCPDMPGTAFMVFVAFVVLNVFTPYWNHPLGWMLLALLATSAPAPTRPALGDH